jgi:hypothetical protein
MGISPGEKTAPSVSTACGRPSSKPCWTQGCWRNADGRSRGKKGISTSTKRATLALSKT